MAEITKNGKAALKVIFTDFLSNFNSYNIKDKLGISNAGSLKLLRSLNKKNLLTSEKIGNAIIYKPNLNNRYLLKLLELIFLDDGDLSSFVRGWIYDLRSFAAMTRAIFIYGSVLRKEKEARDVDVCFVLKSHDTYAKAQAKVNEMNKTNRLKMHPLYLTTRDFEEKLAQKDSALVEMVKSCIVVHGQEVFVGVLKNVQSK